MFYELLMLLVLVLLVLVIVLACVGFGTVVRWILRRKRSLRSPAWRSSAASASPAASEANAPRLDASSDDFVFEPERTEASGESPPFRRLRRMSWTLHKPTASVLWKAR